MTQASAPVTAAQGALLMLVFGLGTLPNLLLMGAAAAQLGRWVRIPAVRTLAGSLVIVFGLAMLYDAWGLRAVTTAGV